MRNGAALAENPVNRTLQQSSDNKKRTSTIHHIILQEFNCPKAFSDEKAANPLYGNKSQNQKSLYIRCYQKTLSHFEMPLHPTPCV